MLARIDPPLASRIKAPALASAACAAALVPLVAAAYAPGPAERLDASLLVRISTHAGPVASAVAGFFAHLADPLPLLAMTVVVCGLGLAWGRRREALAAAVVVAGANVTTQILKVALAHPRPDLYPGHSTIWPTAFPSGHTTAAVSIAVALALVAPPRLLPAALLGGGAFAALVGVSVVALEWHYPSDVLGAFLVASSWGFAALAALRIWGAAGSPRPWTRLGAARPQTASRAAISMK
jgi:membrane-associated phospholipid phosphatase